MNIRKTYSLPLRHLIVALSFIASFHTHASAQIPMHSPDKNQALLNEPIDISGDFRNFSNTYYVADSLSAFDPKTGKGEITYRRYQYFTRQAFNNMLAVLRPVRANEFPDREYAASPALPFLRPVQPGLSAWTPSRNPDSGSLLRRLTPDRAAGPGRVPSRLRAPSHGPPTPRWFPAARWPFRPGRAR